MTLRAFVSLDRASNGDGRTFINPLQVAVIGIVLSDVVGAPYPMSFGGPSDPRYIAVDFNDDESDILAKIKDYIVTTFSVSKHNVVIFG